MPTHKLFLVLGGRAAGCRARDVWRACAESAFIGRDAFDLPDRRTVSLLPRAGIDPDRSCGGADASVGVVQVVGRADVCRDHPVLGQSLCPQHHGCALAGCRYTGRRNRFYPGMVHVRVCRRPGSLNAGLSQADLAIRRCQFIALIF